MATEVRTVYKEIGQRIRQRRKELKITQKDLAAAMGLTAGYIGHLERGTRTMSIEVLLMLCTELKVAPSWLLGWRIED